MMQVIAACLSMMVVSIWDTVMMLRAIQQRLEEVEGDDDPPPPARRRPSPWFGLSLCMLEKSDTIHGYV
jgi:hypothetical protein